MRSRALFRSLRHSARPPPASRTIPRGSSQIYHTTRQPLLRRFQSNYPPGGRFRPTHPERAPQRHTRWDPSEIERAKPLIDSQRLADRLRSRGMAVFVILLAGGGIVFYQSHIEEVPVSGRRRFIFFSEETVEQEGNQVYRSIMADAQQNGSLVPAWDARNRMVRRVMERLIHSGELGHVNWEIHVLDSPEANAFVLPGGKVFVYTGILPIARTDDGLATILGHEIAHNLARHSAESLSKAVILLMPIRWLFIAIDGSGYGGGLGRILGDAFLQLGIMRPASRAQESEADYIGLMMMAKACYDPNAAVGVWERMEAAQQKSGQSPPQWLSTHPSNTNRIKKMIEWLPKAEQERSESDCGATTRNIGAFSNAMNGFWS